ncbi:MAG: MFS transporter [Gammaproteobacteria bacterium]|nr:MFS transporter [Gammaproteobacteria bacterium]
MSEKLVRANVFQKARRHRMRLAWIVWFVAAVFVLFQFFLQLSSGEIIASLMKSFALTAFGGGLLASSYYYIYVALQIPTGMLIDRYGPRGILSFGALMVCLGCLIFYAAKTVFIAFVGRILMGGGSAFAFVGCLNVISIWFPARRFAFMAAIVETAGMIGAIVGDFWLAHFLERTGWRGAMLFAAIFSGILSIFLLLIVRNNPKRKKLPVMASAKISLMAGLKQIMRNPIIWVNGIYSGVMFGIVTVFIALWAIPFFELSHHVDLVTATLCTSALYVGVAVGGPVLGWLDGKTRWRREIMIFNAFCAAVFLFLSIYCINLSLIIIAVFLFFTGICASSYVLTFAIANEIATPNNRSTSIGFTNMLCVIFAPIFQPFVGFLITYFDGKNVATETAAELIVHFQWAVTLVPMLALIAGVLAFYLPKRK